MDYPLTVIQFRKALKDGKLLGVKCNHCENYILPPKKVCSMCDSEKLETIEFSRDGTIKTGTVIYVTPKGYPKPTVVVIVELDEGPWVTANLINWDPEKGSIMEIIGCKGKIDYKDVPAHEFSAGDQLALTFSMT